ncbi:MAG: hypothetical protein GX023_03495 [Tissierellia bacterium]|nr:hypothetical protein [Tissierellia bacterium]
MTNEEFQKIVLEELKGLREDVADLKEGQSNLEEGQLKLEQRQSKLEQGQEEIKRELRAVVEQTAVLTEFREEINIKIDKIIDELNTLEIVTSKNWNDIARLKSINR